MNKEYISSNSKMVAVTDENGEIALRESSNNLIEILETENLKEEIENKLFSLKGKKIDIENCMKERKKDNKKENIISLVFLVLFIITSIKFNLFAIILNEIGNVGFWLIGGMLAWGGINTSKIKRDIESEVERKLLVCKALITLLEHLLEKTNTKLRELKEIDKSSIEFSYDRTKVNMEKVNDLNIKLTLINKFKDNPDDVVVDSYKMYDLRNKDKSTSIDKEEREIISFCQNACRITNMKRVLQRTMR